MGCGIICSGTGEDGGWLHAVIYLLCLLDDDGKRVCFCFWGVVFLTTFHSDNNSNIVILKKMLKGSIKLKLTCMHLHFLTCWRVGVSWIVVIFYPLFRLGVEMCYNFICLELFIALKRVMSLTRGETFKLLLSLDESEKMYTRNYNSQKLIFYHAWRIK